VRHTHTKRGTRSAPKFPHLPAQRARKLREEWIAKQKIKNAYRSQIRCGALSSCSAVPKVSPNSEDDDSGDDPGDGDEAIASASSDSALPQPDSSSPQPSERQKQSNLTTSRTNVSAPSRNYSNTLNHSVHSGRQKRKAGQGTPSAAPPHDDKAARARELLREAYSPASLHTFKSDPLHKRGPWAGQRGRGRGGRIVGGAGLGGAMGRGQPDMRKRMGALLAQIEARK